MDLARDLLDKAVFDRNGRELGRVDGVVLEQRDDAAPRVVGIEIGPAVLGARLSPFLGRLARAFEHVLGISEGRPVQIPFSQILEVQDGIVVDLAAGDTAALALERKVRDLIVKLPGASR